MTQWTTSDAIRTAGDQVARALEILLSTGATARTIVAATANLEVAMEPLCQMRGGAPPDLASFRRCTDALASALVVLPASGSSPLVAARSLVARAFGVLHPVWLGQPG